MKKLLSISLTLAMLCAFTACGKNNDSNSNDDNNTPVVTEAPTEAEQPSEEPSEAPSEDKKPAATGESPAKALYTVFQGSLAGGTTAPADIAQAMIDANIMPFMAGAMEAQEGWLNGFDEEISGFKTATFFGPMIGTIPFVGYVFELEDGADVEAFKTTLNEKSNLAWNVCTQADEKLCESDGNIVLFIMAPAAFEEEPPVGELN